MICNLEYGEQSNRKAIEIGGWSSFWEVESAAKELHAQ